MSFPRLPRPLGKALRTGVVATVVACGEEAESRDVSIERDSAGIRIVEAAGPRLGSNLAWNVGEPHLRIGQAEGDSTRQLYRVTDAIRLAPDTIVIVNGGTAEVRWYDGEGSMIRSVGRAGAGPGEFSEPGPGSMCVRPDGDLLVGDPIQQRANVFSRTGEFVAVVNLAGDAAFPSIQGCFADGTYLGWRSASPRDRVPGTIIQARLTWSRVAADGGRIADLVTLPASPRYLLDQDDGTATYHTVPFTTSPSAAAFGRYLYVAPVGRR